MKYIKLFERLTLAKREQQETYLDEFTKIHLAYLSDDGFEMYAVDYSDIDYKGLCTSILISKKGFTWSEIEDKFIPYLYMLNKEYQILKIVFYRSGEKLQYDNKKDIEKIIRGKIDEIDEYLLLYNFYNIRIIVKE